MRPKALHFTGYDPIFEAAAAKYLHGWDWRWLKAQGWQESRFDPEAISPVGACGVMQFMPATWEEVGRKLWGDAFHTRNTFDPEDSILAGAFYMSRLIGQWKAQRPKMDRYCLALASYNAGIGNLLKAQENQNDAALYANIIQGLPDVTGHHSKETIGYVESIFNHYRVLVVGR